MNNSRGAVQKHEILRGYDDSTVKTDYRSSSSHFCRVFWENLWWSRFLSSTPLNLLSKSFSASTFVNRCEIRPEVSTSQIRSDGTVFFFCFGPNKERASCWEYNSGLVLVPSAEAWLLSTKASGQKRAEPSGIRPGHHIH